MKKKDQGITLIALIITIIIMLILVAVSINIAIKSGLFKTAGTAVKDTRIAGDKEQELAGGKITIGNETYESIDEYLVGKEAYKWDKILKEANENPEKYKHEEQKESTAIGIGTDGKPVNMDLWNYEELENSYDLVGEAVWVTGVYSYERIPAYLRRSDR